METESNSIPFLQSFTTTFIGLVTVLVSYLVFKLYKSTVVPEELASLPRVPILATLKAQLFTKGGFIKETEVLTKAVTQWCVDQGKDKDAWRDMYLIWLFGNWGVVLGKPELIRTLFSNTGEKKVSEAKRVLAAKHLRFSNSFPKFVYKDVGFFLNDKFLGTNVILSNGDVWKRHRKIANPAFHRSWATSMMGNTGRVLIQELDVLGNAATDCFDWMQRLTLDILSLAAYGKNLDSLRNPQSELVKLYNSIMKDLQTPIFMLIPLLQRIPLIPLVRDLTKRIEKFDEFILSVIKEKEKEVRKRLENGESKEEGDMDLLERMLEVSLNDPTFTREDLRSNVVIFFVAGHDTTASALTTTLYYLGMKKHIQDKARNEVINVMGDIEPNTPADKVPFPTTLEQAQMDYLTYIIKESLRLYPSVTGLPLRRTSKTLTLGPVTLPMGTPLHVDIFGVQRDPTIWGKNTNEFIPERWEESVTGGAKIKEGKTSQSPAGLGESSAVHSLASGHIPMMPSAHGFTWVPFGGGQRMCLGQQFSLIEQRVIMSMLLLRYEWKVVGDKNALSGHPLTASGVLLHPVEVKLEFTKRK